MYEIEGLAVAADLFFIAVAQVFLAEDDRADAGRRDFDALDAVRRNSAFDQGMFAQRPEFLRRLLGEQLLLTQRLAPVGEVPGCRGGDVLWRVSELAKRHHVGE